MSLEAVRFVELPSQPRAEQQTPAPIPQPQQAPQPVQQPQVVVSKPQSTPSVTPQPRPRAAQPQPLMKSPIFDLRGELNSKSKGVAEEEAESVVRREDPEAEAKLKRCGARIVEYIANSRPRFRPQFEAMVIEGSRITIEVPSAALSDEVRRAELEIMSHIVEMAGVDGYVELVVKINEEIKAKRPIKIEDKIIHFTKLNPLIVELTEALDLQVES